MALQKYYRDFEIGEAEPAIGKLADLMAEIVPERAELQLDPPRGQVRGRFISTSVDAHIHHFSSDIVFDTDNDTCHIPEGSMAVS